MAENGVDVMNVWLGMLRKSAFINDYVAEKYRKRTMVLGVCTIISMFTITVINGCSVSLLGTATPNFNGTSPSNSVVKDETAVWVSLAFSIATVIITAILGSIHSFKELFGWDAFVTELNDYVKDAISLSGTLEVNISLNEPPTNEFINDFGEKMIAFRNSAPNIGMTNFVEGEQRWNDYLQTPKNIKMMINQRFPVCSIHIHDRDSI